MLGNHAAAEASTADRGMVVARGLMKSFGENRVLNDFSVTVNPGEVLCLVGKSGCGETTFLRCLNRLETIDSGYLNVNGEMLGYRQKGKYLVDCSDRELAHARQQIGVVFQSFNLFNHMNVLANVTSGRRLALGERPEQVKPRAIKLLEQVGLADKASMYPSQLSGGQQQRVAIARALAMEPQLMLFDEPTSALDSELADEVLDVMRELAQQGMTMIVVTHELHFARGVADQIGLVEDGRIARLGRPSQMLHEVNGRLAVVGTSDGALAEDEEV